MPEDLLWVEDPDSKERLRVVAGELRQHDVQVGRYPGNGRVARLMSHAMLLESLDTGGLWSVARGLARNVAEYKRHLASCDRPRRNDVDGRGALSEEELANFTRFMLEVCIDQVEFMEGLVQPERLRTRILLWAEEEVRLGVLPARTGQVIEAILYRGELPRADVSSALDARVVSG